MQILKYFMLFLLLVSASLMGKILSKRYVYRLEELEEIKTDLNILKTKIKFTYEPLPQIFSEFGSENRGNISNIFKNATKKMEKLNAEEAWKEAVEESATNLNMEDKKVLKNFSKMLGKTDLEGQISQIEVTESFLETQIRDAEEEKQKNEKLYSRLGTTIGLAIVIILA